MHQIIELLAQKISINRQKIDEFFAKNFTENPPLFYNSVDLRHYGIKIAPIDTNCFPAGFNNLGPTSKIIAKRICNEFFIKNFLPAKKVLIIPESHTRNAHYLSNVLALREIIAEKNANSKTEVIVGTLIPELIDKTIIDFEINKKKQQIELYPLQKKSGKIVTIDGFEPDIIVLNNDLTGGIPEILHNTTTPIVPGLQMGWHQRKKSNHFDIYNRLASEIAEILEIDYWLISSLHRACEDIDFKNHDKATGGLSCLAKAVDELMAILRNKYKQYNIKEEPYCYVKANSGTYGIAVWPVSSGQDILEINKKERNNMNMLKGSVPNTTVMIQEGIPTIDRIDGKVAEPMIYMINASVAGNLFRINENRDERISLNASGATFVDFENIKSDQLSCSDKVINKNNLTEVYELISRLACLAASIEAKNLK